jgi:hypothetical protein
MVLQGHKTHDTFAIIKHCIKLLLKNTTASYAYLSHIVINQLT